ncbi:hypothetical protein [Salmonirosea aquatica]|uniref:hypothetical protein n=1 Tax=Salmonirosea aquatica TaxID=2654236 RepID=UPI0035715164
MKKDNTKKKVLQYVREPVLTGQLFREYGDIIAKKYLKIEKYDRISEIDKNVTYYIDVKKYTFYDLTSADFDIFEEIIDLDDVIRNERIFRYDLSYYDALQLVYGCTKFFLEFFKKNNYDILLTHIVDEYVVDILVRVARYYNVEIISYCANSFDKNYISITERGEYVKVRQPDEDEIDLFYSSLNEKSSKPYVLSKKTVYKNIIRKYFLYKTKYLIHYQLLYKIIGRKSYRYMMTMSDTYPRNLKDIFLASKYMYRSIDLIPEKLETSKTVYIPLHYHPEATTDYWISDPKYLTYYPSLIKTIKFYSERGFQVIVKEHTASYMQRDISLYKAIASIPHVYLINPFITTYEVFEYVDFVVVWTGTTGVEAIMQNKKVILAAGETYYSFGKLAHVGEENLSSSLSDFEKKSLAESILSSFLPIK